MLMAPFSTVASSSATQALTRNSEIERVRRRIARVHTFLGQKAKEAAK